MGVIWSVCGVLTLRAQSCEEPCSALNASIDWNGSGCDVEFFAIAALTPLPGYADPIWSWAVDGVELGSEDLLSLNAEAVQNGVELILTATLQPLDTLSICSCDVLVNLQEVTDAYDWPCSCQPGGAPIADFTTNGQGSCSGIYSFNNASSGAGLTYAWTFGAGGQFGTSSAFNPTADIGIAGTDVSIVPITLVVTDENECMATFTQNITVLETPNALYDNVDPLCTGPGAWPQAYSLSQSDPSFFEGLTSWSVDWGNGEVEVLEAFEFVVSTEYSAYGYYPITFLAVALNGCSTEVVQSLFVGNNPQIGSANPGNTSDLCAPATLAFPISDFLNNDPATVYEVDFGDGTIENYDHPPPALVSHDYTSSSCGATEGGENSFAFSVIASNGCNSSQAMISPIQVVETTAPEISGQTMICAQSTAYFEVNGGYQDVNDANCEGQNSMGTWEVIPLNGQDVPSAPFDQGSSFSPFFTVPGMYAVAYEDFDWIVSQSPCTYDPTDTLEVCVMPLVQSQATFTFEDGCIPMDVQLLNLMPPPICGSFTFQWIVDGGDYEWAPGHDATDENPMVVLLDATVYNITLVTGVSGACPSSQVSFVVSAADSPTVTLEEDGGICAIEQWVSPVLLNPGNGGVSDFEWLVDGTVVSTIVGPLTTSFLQPGEYLISASASNTCGTGVDEQMVTVYSLPDLAVSHPWGSCDLAPVTVSASGATDYVWSPAADLLLDYGDSASFMMNGGLTGSVLGTMDYGNGVMCSSVIPFLVNNFIAPSLEIVGNPLVCAGSFFDLTADVDYVTSFWTVEWTQEGGETATGPTYSGLLELGETAWVEAIVSTSLGCTDTAFIEMGTWELPAVDAGLDVVFCDQSFEELLPAADPSGGVWTGIGVVDPLGVFDPALVGEGTAVLSYEFIDENGCAGMDSIAVMVEAVPTVDLESDVTICDVDTVLTLDSATPSGGSWSMNNGVVWNGGPLDAGPLLPDVYILNYMLGQGSCVASNQLELTVLSNPAASLEASDFQICDGDSVFWNALVSDSSGPVTDLGGYTFAWSGDATQDLDDVTAAFWIGNALELTGTAVLTVTDPSGCQVETDDMVWADAPFVIMPASLEECQQSSVVLLPDANPPGGLWTGPGVVDELAGTFDPGGLEVGTYFLSYTVSDDNGCVSEDSTAVSIITLTEAYAGLDWVICDVDTLLMFEDFNPSSNGTWVGLEVLNAATGTVDAGPLAPGVYEYTYEYGSGSCFSSDGLSVTILERPVADWMYPASLCAGESGVFEINPTAGEGPYALEWVTAMDSVGSTGLTAYLAWNDAGSHPVEVTVTDDNGCFSSSTVNVDVDALPVVSAGQDITFCNQPVVTALEGFSPGLAQGGTGTFTGLGTAATSVTSDGMFDPAISGVGVFEVEYAFSSGSSGCYSADTLTINVVDATPAYAGLDTTVCSNAPMVQLNGFTPLVGVTWSGVGAAAESVVNAMTGVINPQVLMPGTYEMEMTYGAGSCFTADTLSLVIQDLPEIVLGEDDVFCGYGGEVSLTEFAPMGGTWEGPGVTDAAAGLFDSGQGEGDWNLIYWYTDPITACSDTAAHEVHVASVPVANFLGDSLGCVGEAWTPQQLSVGGIEFLWTTDGTEQEATWEPEYTFEFPGNYTVQLIASTFYACADTAYQNIAMTYAPTADFSLSVDNGCAPLSVEVTDASDVPFGTSIWTIDGEELSPIDLSEIVFDDVLDVTVFSIDLSVNNLCGSDQATDEVTVYPQPSLGFALLEDTVCSPYTADILNTSLGGPDALQWDFGNGQTDTGSDPLSPTYFVDEEAVSFPITLTGSNACGVDTFQTNILVQPNTVEAFFSLSAESGCAPLDVSALDLSVDATSITFDFGNGMVASDSLSVTTYEEVGQYTVTQYITNGCSYDTVSVVVDVFAEPVFNLSSDADQYCMGELGAFEVDQVGAGSVDWSFGDGAVASGLWAEHAWDNAGTYWVYSTVYTALFACSASDSMQVEVHPLPLLDVQAATAEGCSPFDVSFLNNSSGADFWQWDYGDGSPNGVVEDPSHIFFNEGSEMVVYDVTLIASSLQSCLDSTIISITVLPVPAVDFSLEADTGCGDPAYVQTMNNTSTLFSFDWLVDGQWVSEAYSPAIEVAGIGAHVIDLEATNAFGCSSLQGMPFEVFANPEAALLVDPLSGCMPLAIAIEDASVGSIGTQLTVLQGAAEYYTGPIPEDSLMLINDGVYTLVLDVVSVEGCTHSVTWDETVVVWPVPYVSFIPDPYAGTWNNPSPLNDSWIFHNESIGGTSSSWDFGDGGVSSEWIGTHTYGHGGIYTVTLTVTNGFGCDEEFSQTVRVEDPLEVYVPTAFTPPTDGFSDGVNDGWRPEISSPELVSQFDLFIYNRAGQLIWHNQDPEAYWIGEARNDGDYFVNNDVYVWVLRIDSEYWNNTSREWRGHVTIIR